MKRKVSLINKLKRLAHVDQNGFSNLVPETCKKHLLSEPEILQSTGLTFLLNGWRVNEDTPLNCNNTVVFFSHT